MDLSGVMPRFISASLDLTPLFLETSGLGKEEIYFMVFKSGRGKGAHAECNGPNTTKREQG